MKREAAIAAIYESPLGSSGDGFGLERNNSSSSTFLRDPPFRNKPKPSNTQDDVVAALEQLCPRNSNSNLLDNHLSYSEVLYNNDDDFNTVTTSLFPQASPPRTPRRNRTFSEQEEFMLAFPNIEQEEELELTEKQSRRMSLSDAPSRSTTLAEPKPKPPTSRRVSLSSATFSSKTIDSEDHGDMRLQKTTAHRRKGRRPQLARNKSWNPSSPSKKNKNVVMQRQLSERMHLQLDGEDHGDVSTPDPRSVMRCRGNSSLSKIAFPAPEDLQDSSPGYCVASEPISLLDLVSKQLPIRRRSARSSNHRHSRRSSLLSPNASTRRNKTVRFATNINTTDTVWSLVRTVDQIPADLRGEIWWTKQELDVRFDKDTQMLDLMKTQCGKLLHKLFVCCKKDSDANLPSPTEMAQCAALRGLEADTFPQLRAHRKEHRAAVLRAFEQEPDCPDTIRLTSLQYSRTNTRVAAKMASLDALVVG